jgi:hypothetical protein
VFLATNDGGICFLPLAKSEEELMRQLFYALAALTTVAIATPTIASAEGFGIYIGGDRDYYGDRYYGPRAEFYGPRAEFYGHDRGWHRGWYHRDYDRGVVIRRHYWED